ncbi:hypothetical protein HYX07_03885 [Candidatus Woesearchaeota archaeon]|nr:hypothetical protein [Candidatus Woesearchaeota archaeon]
MDSPLFTPSETYLTAPEIDETRLERPNRVVLGELPLGSLVEFDGRHYASRYLMQLFEDKTGNQVRIWLNRRANCAVASLDSIISENVDMERELGVLQVGRNYTLPTFHYRDEKGLTQIVVVMSDPRWEPVTEIRLQRPT